MKGMFKKGITYFILGIITMIWFWLFFLKSSTSEYHQVEVIKTDTVYVNKPYKEIVIKEVEIEKPVKVLIYKTDTLFREKLIRDTLISGIEFDRNKAVIHTVTPKGIPMVKQYPLKEIKEAQIDHKGNLKVKRKRRNRVVKNAERILIFLGGVIIGRKMN